jgi:CubicO group peptidase (beta-lactamase class C family)
MWKAVLLLLLFVLLAAPALAQTSTRWADVVREFDRHVAAEKIAGASILHMRDGKVIAQHNTGYEDLAKKKPVDDDTIYHWGSITKALTAIAILQLRDEGKLTLDDRVTRYIPELRRVHDPYGRIDEITIRMLLNHTAGFSAGTWPYRKGHPWEPFEPTEWSQLVAMMPYQELQFAPGERYGYSNPAYVYLGRIIEQLTGDPWDGYVYKNIFLPLGLHRSYFRNTPVHLRGHRSHNYYVGIEGTHEGVVDGVADNAVDFDPGITTPNGGWNAPPADVARWVAFLTGKPSSNVVLKRSSLEEMWQPGKSMNADHGGSMGLSFYVIPRGDTTLLGHTGAQAAFTAFFYFNPKTSTAVIAAFNSVNVSSKGARPDLRNSVFAFLSEPAR